MRRDCDFDSRMEEGTGADRRAYRSFFVFRDRADGGGIAPTARERYFPLGGADGGSGRGGCLRSGDTIENAEGGGGGEPRYPPPEPSPAGGLSNSPLLKGCRKEGGGGKEGDTCRF